ncbi:MAG: YgiQ family radical SAM protein [Methylococcaceae bacterium]|nr:MAG: YgiQ family radical SAM protein [Methylococcaceae bacterium]
MDYNPIPVSLPPRDLFSYRPYWAKRYGIAPQLPLSRAEMEALGWDSCDVILVTGDAYVDHPSFGMALIGRLLEAQGFRVGIIAQPDWHSAADFQKLGRPNLFFGVTGGNMDSMVNRYTSDKRIRSNDAYTPDGAAGKRPDRSVLVYSQRCREAYKDVPLIIGGIEASLRRIAHYDYWSDTVRRSVLVDAKADLLVYGNGERSVVALAHRLAKGETIDQITDLRGTAFIRKSVPAGWTEIDAGDVDQPSVVVPHPSPYDDAPSACRAQAGSVAPIQFQRKTKTDPASTVIRLPSYEQVKADALQYAHASRTLHLETNPGNARALIQRHGDREVWLNPPPIPLTTAEMDRVYELPYSRLPHHAYGGAKLPAFEMIQHSVTIMRGCFGGCTFCSITEHEGRIIQSRSEDSIVDEIAAIRDTSPTFSGHISDLGGPTANMYRLGCRSKAIAAACRKLSCVYPQVCHQLVTDHGPLIRLYRRARALSGIKKIFVASGLRYDLAVLSPEYVKELASHHVGGYLKIAPEHTEAGPLAKMMKPGIASYDRFKALFDKFSREAGKEQYLIPYFIAAHPGSTDEDMLNLALWLKRNDFRLDQVQAFLPSPMAIASAMYHTGKNPLHKISRSSEAVFVPKGLTQRRLHKAFLRYHDPNNWPMLREALKRMGRADLIGNGKVHLVPSWQPAGTGDAAEGRRVAYKAMPQRGKPRRSR